ncbi:MAG: hypothetical protein ABIQ47_08380 [Tepidiformaceae bacterium]
MTHPFPGGLSELEFVDSYCRSALKKPQMAADSALRALVFSDSAGRALLTGLIASELVEACRRLVAVHTALSDRRFSIAQTLLRPLPGAAEWAAFVHQAGTFTPEQMLRELSLGEDALEHAEHLRSQPALADFTAMVSAAETGNAMLLTPNGRNVADECWLGGVDSNGESVASSFGTSESEATTLADVTADLSAIARGFLGTYLGHRLNAGRRD